jgi:hypothetical protein
VPNLGSSFCHGPCSSIAAFRPSGIWRCCTISHDLQAMMHDRHVAQTWQVRQILRIWTKKEVAAISVAKAPEMPQFSPPWLISKALAKSPRHPRWRLQPLSMGLRGPKSQPMRPIIPQYSRYGRIGANRWPRCRGCYAYHTILHGHICVCNPRLVLRDIKKIANYRP